MRSTCVMHTSGVSALDSAASVYVAAVSTHATAPAAMPITTRRSAVGRAAASDVHRRGNTNTASAGVMMTA